MKRPKSFIYLTLPREYGPNRVAVKAISVNGSGQGRKCGNVASAGRATSETRWKRSTSVTIFFFFIPPAIFVGFVYFFIIDILIPFQYRMWFSNLTFENIARGTDDAFSIDL